MSHKPRQITIKQGVQFRYAFRRKNPDGTPRDSSGVTARVELKPWSGAARVYTLPAATAESPSLTPNRFDFFLQDTATAMFLEDFGDMIFEVLQGASVVSRVVREYMVERDKTP